MFAVNVSFDEVVVTIFINGIVTTTLPVTVWDAIQYEISPILPAISTIVMGATLLLLAPILFVTSRRVKTLTS